jgi:hypothetical protein
MNKKINATAGKASRSQDPKIKEQYELMLKI